MHTKLLRPVTILCTLLPPLLPAADLSIIDLGPGDLLVTEYLADPAGVADAEGETRP